MRLWMNSLYVEKGDYFLVNQDNEKYVNDAIGKGASKIITEIDKKYKIETIKVKSIKEYLYSKYKDKINKLKIIGITGTNGKTTTCYLIYQMLKKLGVKVCYIGTIGFYINNKVYSLENTTPSMDFLYNILSYAHDEKNEVVVMEVSSHALKQNRIYGILFDAIGVTNITLDHLDYHKSLNDYVESKRKLIYLTKNKIICILNKHSKYYKKFINKYNNSFVIDKDIKVKKIKMFFNKTKICIKDDKKYTFYINLIGKFNVYNFLMAYKIIKELGYDKENLIISKSYDFIEPVGRMQKIYFNDNTIYIDYAHTPDAVKNALKTVKKINNNGIITIIGCGGNRDKSKRSIMGNIACKYSNYVIFTNDNPRNEDEKEIIKDILKGAHGKYEVIYDRYDAIQKGISLLNKNMILMILGKGHENYQIIGSEKFYFSDYESVINIINQNYCNKK